VYRFEIIAREIHLMHSIGTVCKKAAARVIWASTFLWVAAGSAADTLTTRTTRTASGATAALVPTTVKLVKPPEWAAGCPVPSLADCQQPGYLQGELDDALGCGALQGANDWTCSQLLQQAADAYPAGPSVFAHTLEPAGVVASAAHVPQDPGDASATSFAGELTSPANQYYGASLFADGQIPDTFSIEDPRGVWQGGDQGFESCQEYAHDSFYEVTNFWYEVGHARHDHLRTFEIAFGPWLSHGSIGTRHTNGSDFTDISGNDVLPSSRVVYRNRFFDLPGEPLDDGPQIVWGGNAGAPEPDLRGALASYDPLGLQIVQDVEAHAELGVKDMQFYRDYFDHMTVEAVPGLGLSIADGGGGGEGPAKAYSFGDSGDDGIGDVFTDAGGGDPLIAITGQVPLDFAGGKLMRRMFSTELDELYDLQKRKDRLAKEWLDLNRHFAGSGWTIQDLLDELDPELGLSAGDPAPVPGGGGSDSGVVAQGASGYAALSGGGGICCGGAQLASPEPDDGDGGLEAVFRIDPPQPDPDDQLSPESAARKLVLDGLLEVYAQAMDAGCLEAGVTYCDFSVKEFALEAVPHASEEQQTAYEECLAILPPPFASNLGQTRKIIDPLADVPGPVPAALADEYADLLEMECFVEVDTEPTATHLHWIADKTAECRGNIPDYQAALSEFMAEVALHEAKARLASVPELLDPDTGEIIEPGHSASWDERKGSKYFGLGMTYNYAFDTDVDGNVCNFDLVAGGDFSADVDILTANLELVDVAAWVRTGEELVDIHAEVLGIALFSGLQVDGMQDGEVVGIDFARSDHQKKADVAGLTTNFFLGPIPMSLSVGAGGGIGYRFQMEGSLTAFEGNEQSIDVCPELVLAATLEPYVGVYGYIEVALDIVIARAGVRGEVTVVQLSIPVTLDMSLAAVPASPVDLELGVGMSVAARFETLSGRISAFGELGPCPLCARLEKTIVKWDGFRWDKVLYDQSYDVSVGDLALVLAGS
jgi:hypothetical protein